MPMPCLRVALIRWIHLNFLLWYILSNIEKISQNIKKISLSRYFYFKLNIDLILFQIFFSQKRNLFIDW